MSKREIKYSLLNERFAVCQLPAGSAIPQWAPSGEFFSISRTEEEVSIVCETNQVPAGVRALSPWLCLKLLGPFSLMETGVLSSFVKPLAERGVPVFTVSTYNTDYVFIPEEFWGESHDALMAAGHIMV